MADLYAPQNPGLAAFIQPYLSWRERQANESRLADFLLPKAIPDYLAGLAYGTNPREPPLTSLRSTLAYGLPAVEALGIAPAAIPTARGGLAAYGALERRMIPPAGQLNMMVGPVARAEILNQADPAVRAMITDQLKLQGLRDVQITDGVIRGEIARRNAVTMMGLPAENTAADRAAALGFDTQAYHGTTKDFEEFKYFDYPEDAQKLPYSEMIKHDKVEAPGGYYFSPDIFYSYISKIGDLPGGRVMPVNLKMPNPKSLDPAGIESAGYPHRVAKLRKEGFDSAIDSLGRKPDLYSYDTPTQYLVFDNNNIRSRFAAFDPARAKEADILAGLAGASLIPALTLQDYFRQGQ